MRGYSQLLTFLMCFHHLLLSVARAEQLQGCSSVLPVALPAAIAFAWRFLEWCVLLQPYLCAWRSFSQWSHLGLFSGNRNFQDTLHYFGRPFHYGYCMNIGFSSSMTLSCCCKEIQKSDCSLRLTGRQASSTYLSWMVSFSCFNKKPRWKLLKVM